MDISLTKAGREVYDKFRSARLSTMYETLSALAPEDRFEFMRMLRQIRAALEQRLAEA